MQNGHTAILGTTGLPVTSEDLHPPDNRSDWFGFMGQQGEFITLRVEEIQLVSSNAGGRFNAVMRRPLPNGQMIITLEATDGFRLMKRLGWSARNH